MRNRGGNNVRAAEVALANTKSSASDYAQALAGKVRAEAYRAQVEVDVKKAELEKAKMPGANGGELSSLNKAITGKTQVTANMDARERSQTYTRILPK